MKLIYIDNVLSKEANKNAFDKFNCNRQSSPSVWFNIDEFPECIAPLVEIAAKEFDLSSCVGFEVWTHYNTGPNWHYDKDEYLSQYSNELKFPLCSIAYYVQVNNLIGGDFLTKNLRITPQTNSVALFSAGVYHKVEPYTGERFALLITPWQYKPNL